jgi:hypothetical protein
VTATNYIMKLLSDFVRNIANDYAMTYGVYDRALLLTIVILAT